MMVRALRRSIIIRGAEGVRAANQVKLGKGKYTASWPGSATTVVRRPNDKCTGTSCTLTIGYAEWLDEVPSLLPQMRRRSTLEEFHPECTGTSMRVFLLQRLRERDGGLVATRSRALPPTVDSLNS
jgi:hypothetical protein